VAVDSEVEVEVGVAEPVVEAVCVDLLFHIPGKAVIRDP